MIVLTIWWIAAAGSLLDVLPAIFWFFNLGWYTFEWITSGTRKFLSNQKQERNVYQYVEQLRQTEPGVEFSAVCWHMETRTRLVTHTDGRGNTYTTTETYQEMVITHQRTEPYVFARWKDSTAALPRLDGCDMTKLYLTKDYECLDAASAARHNAELADFKARTPRDVNMDFSNYVVVPGFEERTLCYVEDSGPPPWVNLPSFVLASLFFCTLPYRMALDRHVAEQGHEIYKLIGD